MRLVDFFDDLRHTSRRIAERDAYIDRHTIARLTGRTLMRPDVVAYFDALKAESGVPLSDADTIMFYAVMFAFLVNARPRATHDEALIFARRIAGQIQVLPQQQTSVLCNSGVLRWPRRINDKINRLLRRTVQSGLFCAYLPAPPAGELVRKHSLARYRDASLFIFPVTKDDASLTRESDRVHYSAPIFTASDWTLAAVYIGTLH